MAENRKEIIEKLNEDLDLLDDSLKSIATTLDKQMSKQFSALKDDAEEFIEAFSKGENITKKLNDKLLSLKKTSNQLGVEKIRLEFDYSQALASGNINEQSRIREKLIQNKLATQQLESTQTILVKLSQINEEEEKIAKEKQKQNSLSNILENNLYKTLGTTKANVTEMLTLSGIFALIISKALEFNKISVELSKNLGYSGGEADELTYSLAASSVASNNINLNSKAAAEAISQMSEATGYVAEFSQDALETQIMLTKQFGLTGAEAARIYELSVLTGKSSSQVNDEMVGAFAATRNQLKVGVPFKATMAAAAKVSGQLAANLQNNPALITKAVVQASALGTTLEQTASQAEKLLDFGSSIENELKAELLTGKQLNLERARAAALAGDQVTLAQELAKNVGSIEEFERMNVLQQKALAEAVGLTADQLAEQLKKQQIAKETGKSIAEQNKEDLLKAQKRQNLQDIINAAVEKLSDILTVIASGPIGMLLSGLASILSNSYALYGILGAIAILKFNNITNAFKNLGGIKDKLKDVLSGGKKAAESVVKKATESVPSGTKAGGITESLSKINTGALLRGAAAMLVASSAIYVFGKAVQELEKVKDWTKVAIGLGAFALSMGILGSIGPSATAGLTELAAGLEVFGAAMLTGVAALGLAAFIIAAVSLGYALNLAAPAVEAFGKGMAAVFDSFAKMDIGQILSLGPALTLIGIGLTALGTGAIVGSIGALIAIGIISQLANKGDQLMNTATALQSMATALTQVSSALAGIDVSKLDALDNFAANRSNESIVGGITDFITAPIKAIGESISGGGEKGNDMAPMITAINEVRAEVAKLANRPININMDGKKVGSGLTQGSYKVA
jgi:hypothetical protein